jgi:hypothetical protein
MDGIQTTPRAMVPVVLGAWRDAWEGAKLPMPLFRVIAATVADEADKALTACPFMSAQQALREAWAATVDRLVTLLRACGYPQGTADGVRRDAYSRTAEAADAATYAVVTAP